MWESEVFLIDKVFLIKSEALKWNGKQRSVLPDLYPLLAPFSFPLHVLRNQADNGCPGERCVSCLSWEEFCFGTTFQSCFPMQKRLHILHIGDEHIQRLNTDTHELVCDECHWLSFRELFTIKCHSGRFTILLMSAASDVNILKLRWLFR